MLHVYLKNMRKSWFTGLVPPLIVALFVVSIAAGFPLMLDIIMERLETMSSPIGQAILGDLGLEELGMTWQAVLFMYGGATMNLLVLFVAVFIPTRLLSAEIDKKTFDVMLSYPIPRWRYLLEKYGVYLTYSLLFPISLVSCLIGATLVMAILFPEGYTYTNPVTQDVTTHLYEVDVSLILNHAVGIYLLLFALGSISLLCASIFLDSIKSLSVAGVLIIGQYFLDSIGGLFATQEGFGIQSFSLFSYFSIGDIIDTGMLPPLEIVIVVGVGLIALVSALVIFEKREFAI